MLTTLEQIWALYDFRIRRFGGGIGTESIVRTIRWRFSIFFRPNGHRIRCSPRTNNFEHCTFLDPPNRRSNWDRIDRQNNLLTIFTFFCQMVTECDVDPVQQFWTLYDFRICRICRRIGTKSIFRVIRWRFSNFFGQMDTECDVDHTQNSFEHCTISGCNERSNCLLPIF